MVKLADVVKEYLIMKGADTQHQFPYYLQLAVKALNEIVIDYGDGHLGTMTNSVYLKVPESKVIPLPPDYINRISITHNVRDHVIPLSEDNSLSMLGRECEPPPTDIKSYYHSYLYNPLGQRDGENVGNQFGVGGGVGAGRYKIEKGYIILNETYPFDCVHLAYICTMQKITGSHMVHEYAVTAVQAGMYHYDIIHKKSVPRGEKIQSRAEYGRAMRETAMRLQTIPYGEALLASSWATIMSPKL